MNLEELIIECNNKADEADNTFFILSKSTDYIKSDNDEYYISDVLEPSRYSVYDSETRVLNRHKRMDVIYRMLSAFSFTPKFNLSIELEQTFLRKELLLTLKPNLYISLSLFGNVFYSGFYSKNNIVSGLKRAIDLGYINIEELPSIIIIERDLKIDEIIGH